MGPIATFLVVGHAYTPTQGQYLAFIHYYMKLNGVPPAEADFQKYFKVSPPSVHQMIVTLEKRGLHRADSGRGTVDQAAVVPRSVTGPAVTFTGVTPLDSCCKGEPQRFRVRPKKLGCTNAAWAADMR